MMTCVKLYGQLGKEFGREYNLDLDNDSVAGAIRAITALRPGFLNAVERLNATVVGYHVQVGDRDIGDAELELEGVGGRTIAITPLLQGADTKGILQIVAGVAILAVGIALAYVGGPAGGLTFLVGLQLIGLGAAIALGGVARLLMSTPSPTGKDKTKTRVSYQFSGAVNVAGEGECVPVIFGRVICGSAIVSADVESVDIIARSGSSSGTTTDPTTGLDTPTGISEPSTNTGGANPVYVYKGGGGNTIFSTRVQ